MKQLGAKVRCAGKALLVLTLVVLGVGYLPSYAQDAAAAVCQPGSAKWEAPGTCEYGCGKATVTFAGPVVEWVRLADAGTITAVCVKAGQDLYYPATGPDGGSYTTENGKDVSHIVIYMAGPNSVGITGEIVAERSLTLPGAALRGNEWGILAALLLGGLLVGLVLTWFMRRYESG